MNELSPYPNLCKAEKIKLTLSSKDITEGFLFSLSDTSIYVRNSRKSVKFFYF